MKSQLIESTNYSNQSFIRVLKVTKKQKQSTNKKWKQINKQIQKTLTILTEEQSGVQLRSFPLKEDEICILSPLFMLSCWSLCYFIVVELVLLYIKRATIWRPVFLWEWFAYSSFPVIFSCLILVVLQTLPVTVIYACCIRR